MFNFKNNNKSKQIPFVLPTWSDLGKVFGCCHTHVKNVITKWTSEQKLFNIEIKEFDDDSMHLAYADENQIIWHNTRKLFLLTINTNSKYIKTKYDCSSKQNLSIFNPNWYFIKKENANTKGICIDFIKLDLYIFKTFKYKNVNKKIY